MGRRGKAALKETTKSSERPRISTEISRQQPLSGFLNGETRGGINSSSDNLLVLI